SKETKRFDDRAYIFDLLARSFIRISEGKPLVILIEGLHGADVSIDALQYIVRRLASTPLLIVATYRTTEVNKSHPVIKMLRNFEDDRRFLSIILQPLSFVEQRSLLTDLTYNPELDDQVVNKLYQITEGNPYFTKEIIYNLVDSGVFVKDEIGCLQLTGDLPLNTETLPETIQQTVENRISRLPLDLQEALSLMSIIGKTFELKDLETIFETDINIDEIIEQLLEYGLIIEDRKSREEKYSFVSAIVCDVVYTNLLPRRKRKSLHKKYAEKLEKRYATRLERVYPQLVHHYSQADIPSKVVSHALNLAKISLNSLSAEDTLRAGKTALDFLDEQTDTVLEAEIRLLLAEAHRLQVNTNEALKELSLAIKICERENQLAKIVQITVLAAEIAWEGRKIDQTMLWIEKGIKIAQEISDFDNLRKLFSLAAMVANLRGDYERAKEYLEEAEKIQPTKIELDKDIIEGGKLIVALPSQIQAACPIEIRFNVEKEVFANIFETLLTIDSRGNLAPHLCERWDSLEENKSFLFTLRPNIQLHNSRMLTAIELKESFQRAIKQTSNLPPAFAQILGVSEYLSGQSENLIGIEVISENKLKIQLQEPSPTYPMLLTDIRTAIVYLEENSLSSFNIIGTGPFKVLLLTSDYVVMEKSSNYWKNPKVLLNRIEFRCGISSMDITAGFKTGDYDLACGLLPEDLEALQLDRRLRINTIVTPRKYTGFILFNSNSLLFSNKQVREILYKITNVQALIWNVLGRFAQPAEGLLPPGISGHDPGRRHQSLSEDKAIEMLEKLGYQSPIFLKAMISPSLRKRYHTLTQALFEIWAKIGIEIVVEPLDLSLDIAEESPEIDLIIEGQIAEYDDPKAFTSDLFHSKTGIFRNYYSSLELDELIEQANAETKPLKKEKLYRKIEDFLLEDFALLPLFHEIDYRVASPNVKGLSLNSIAPYINYSEIGKTGDAPAAIRKKGGGIMYIPSDRDFHSLDPSLVYSDLQGEVIPNIFETLARQSEGGRIIPWLASEIKSEANGKRFRFYLREYIYFHNGRQLTARDVRYSFERFLQNQESQSRLLLSPILGANALINGAKRELEGFNIVSAFEFTIDLAYPISFFPSLVAYAPTSIVPEGTESIDGGWRDSCVGTG
ncbi:MAG: ABC transporter substrate-binding protein, partial [Blastocatellia bacterium]